MKYYWIVPLIFLFKIKTLLQGFASLWTRLCVTNVLYSVILIVLNLYKTHSVIKILFSNKILEISNLFVVHLNLDFWCICVLKCDTMLIISCPLKFRFEIVYYCIQNYCIYSNISIVGKTAITS